MHLRGLCRRAHAAARPRLFQLHEYPSLPGRMPANILTNTLHQGSACVRCRPRSIPDESGNDTAGSGIRQKVADTHNSDSFTAFDMPVTFSRKLFFQRKDLAADCGADPAAAAPAGACCTCGGTSLRIKSPAARTSSGVKSKSGGRGLPFGSLVLGSRSSSKKTCAHDCIGVTLRSGV